MKAFARTKRQYVGKAIIAVALLFISAPCFSQHDHGTHNHGQPTTIPMSDSPHGGMVASAGKYDIEMAVDMLQMEDKVSVYLLSSKGKVLSNADITGSVMFVYEDGTTAKVGLVARGDDHFAAQLEKLDPFTAIVSIKVKGKTITASFEHGGLNTGNTEQAPYTCPMHPEIQGETSGSCPKCGMNLVIMK